MLLQPIRIRLRMTSRPRFANSSGQCPFKPSMTYCTRASARVWCAGSSQRVRRRSTSDAPATITITWFAESAERWPTSTVSSARRLVWSPQTTPASMSSKPRSSSGGSAATARHRKILCRNRRPTLRRNRQPIPRRGKQPIPRWDKQPIPRRGKHAILRLKCVESSVAQPVACGPTMRRRERNDRKLHDDGCWYPGAE
jgi:hypothetical protein